MTDMSATTTLDALARLTTDAAAFRAAPPREPALLRRGGDYQDLLDWPALDELLSDGGRLRPEFRMIRDNAELPESSYTRSTLMRTGAPDSRRISDELSAGATLVLQGMQEYTAPIARFTRRLAHDLARPVHVNAYITPPNAQGFKAHFDPRDSFILQVEGAKTWTLRPPVLEAPLAHESWDLFRRRTGWDTARLEAITPWRELVLRPGDCLWLPRGWVHSAVSEGESSMHLTLSLTAWTEHWALGVLLNQAAGSTGRATLPAGFMTDPVTATTAAGQARAALGTWLDHLSDEELGRVLRSAAAREFPRPARQVSRVLADPPVTVNGEFLVHAEAVVGTSERDGLLILQLADRIVTLPATATEALHELLARARVTMADLAPLCGHAVAERLVRLLWAEGILQMASMTGR